MIRLQVSLDGLDEAVSEFAALPRQIERASKRTIRKVTAFATSQLARQVALTTQIPLSVLIHKGKGRRISSRIAPDGSGAVWLGYNPVKSGYIGQLQQDEGGAWARQFYFEKGFVARMRSGHQGVFKRFGKARLPIDEQTVAMLGAKDAAERVAKLVGPRLRDVMRQELNYEVNVRGVK
ncbi:MAG: hypothetical protein EPN21_13245 [Methylococcaceae bacterium]|nr:MAG: hypothetical protein EPN21_13245 [Methylococcaceae bacterium]